MPVDLSSRPVAVTGVGNGACNPIAGGTIDTPELTGKVEANGRGAGRGKETAVGSSEAESSGLTREDIGSGETSGRLMLGSEATLSVDNERLRVLLVANLTNVGRVVGEHEIGIHDLSVGRDEGQVSAQLIGVDVAGI